MKRGELSPDQAKAVADGASADPSCEDELLDTAKRGSFGELKRRAKARKAAALGDDDARHAAAHRNRTLENGANADGEQFGRFNGPASDGGRFNAFLKPFLDQVFAKARREGRRERTGAYKYDAMMAAMAAANGITDTDTQPVDEEGPGAPSAPGISPTPRGPTPPNPTPPSPVPVPRGGGRANAQLIVRIDGAALKRGHTVAGELCEIDGLGPVPVAAIREFLPDAAIAVVIQDGENVFNVTNFGRRANARQQIVLDLLNVGCTKLGCNATEHLQVDHRIDWSTIRVTELINLDWLCAHDHRLKTHDGWQLEPGTGKRPLYPPGRQPWLGQSGDAAGNPPDTEVA